MTMREFMDVAMATLVGGGFIVLVQLVAAAVAALPLTWLLGTSQLGLALAKYGPAMLINFLAMLLSMWVFLRYSHVATRRPADPARPDVDPHQARASYDG